MRSPDEIATRSALKEIVELYLLTDAEHAEKPLSGADVVEELGRWIETNRQLLYKLGLAPDVTDMQ